MINGIMIATKYVHILSASLLPFIKESYTELYQLQLYQDDEPKHTSKYIQTFS